MDMKNIIYRICIAAVVAMTVSCIQEVFPEGGSLTQAQVSASKTAMKSMIKAVPASMTSSGTIGYYSSYGDHTDFGIPGVHLRLEHMLEDIATMADNPYYNRFYAYDLNQAQGHQYTYCAYFWDMYYTWIRLANDVIASMVPAIEDGADEETMTQLKNNLGQAYAYRAWCYLDLARLYEPKDNVEAPVPAEIRELTVPIVDENTTIEDCKKNPRVSREVMYQFILDDLARAEEYEVDTNIDRFYFFNSVQNHSAVFVKNYNLPFFYGRRSTFTFRRRSNALRHRRVGIRGFFHAVVTTARCQRAQGHSHRHTYKET